MSAQKDSKTFSQGNVVEAAERKRVVEDRLLVRDLEKHEGRVEVWDSPESNQTWPFNPALAPVCRFQRWSFAIRILEDVQAVGCQGSQAPAIGLS